MASRYSLLHLSKRASIFFSAMKALMMRRPPSVSSSWDMVSLHLLCASSDWRFSFLPTVPMIHPMTGTTSRVNTVSCQLTAISVVK